MNNGCPGCGALKGHGYWCKAATPEERVTAMEAQVQHWQKQWDDMRRTAQQADQRAALFHGKYAIVKAENNALRRKLYAQKKRGMRVETEVS